MRCLISGNLKSFPIRLGDVLQLLPSDEHHPMKRIEFTAPSGRTKRLRIRNDQWDAIQEIMAERPNLTLSDLINEALDLARLERVSIYAPFDIYEATGKSRWRAPGF